MKRHTLVAGAVTLALLAGCGLGQRQELSEATTATSPTAIAIASRGRNPDPLPTTAVETAPPAPTEAATAEPTPAPTIEPTPEPTPAPTPHPGSAAMRPAFAADLERSYPHYDLDLQLDTAQLLLHGQQTIRYPNLTGVPLSEIALRMYPNFPEDVFAEGGDVQMTIRSAAIDGQPITAQLAAQGTAVLLPLPAQLQPEAETTIEINFVASIKQEDDGSWPMQAYYPALAVNEGGLWRLDVTTFADKVYASSATYSASISVPAGLTVASSGSTVASWDDGAGHTIYQIESGPIREFAWTAGDFLVDYTTAGEVQVRVFQQRGVGMDGATVAAVAAAALADFEWRFGPYPYAELDLQIIPYRFDGGAEFPGMIFLYSNGIDAGARYVTAHEVAHQWWYGLAGNDIFNEPWLDEALAQYAGIIYAEDVAGAEVAAADWQREVERRYQGALASGDLPVGLAITDFPDFNTYYVTVYGKGPVFLRTLRHQIGDEAFFGGLQIAAARHRYGTLTTSALRQAWEEASGSDLGPIFDQWIGRH